MECVIHRGLSHGWDRDISTAYCWSSSGDDVDWLCHQLLAHFNLITSKYSCYFIANFSYKLLDDSQEVEKSKLTAIPVAVFKRTNRIY